MRVGGRMRQRVILAMKERERELERERERERESNGESRKICEQSKQYNKVYTWVT